MDFLFAQSDEGVVLSLGLPTSPTSFYIDIFCAIPNHSFALVAIAIL